MSDYVFRRNGKFISGYSTSDIKADVINITADNPEQAKQVMRYLPAFTEPADFSSDDFDYMAQHD